MGDYSNASPFVEAQLMLAAGENDTAEMERLVGDMLDGELDRISHVVGAERRSRRLASQ